MEPRIRALALDIDGTLVASDKRIPEFTRREVARVVAEYGIPIFLVTARPPASARRISAELGVHAEIAAFSGALVEVRGEVGMTTLRSVPIDADTVMRSLELAADLPLHRGVYGRDFWAVSDMGYWGLREARNTAVWPQSVGTVAVDRAAREEQVFKVMFRGESEYLRTLEARLRPLSEAVFVHRTGNVLEYTAASARKFSALELLSAHHGVDTSEVMAFGDTVADHEMLESVGFGIVMGNAAPGVAPHAERTLSNDEDGVGMMLRRHFPTDQQFEPWT